MAGSRSPVDRVLGAVVPRAVGAVDPDDLLERIDLDALLERLDIDAVIQRIDADGLMNRIDIDALLSRVDIDGLVARVDVEALVAQVDVDGLVGRIDLNGLMARIDLDALLARVDVDALVARIDLDALMARVDIDALMARVDIDALMGRVDLDALLAGVDVPGLVARAGIDKIVADSATGLATRTLDLARRQVLGLDVVLLGAVDRVLRRAPAAVSESTPARSAGPVARLLGLVVDSVSVSAAFSLVVFVTGALFELFTGRSFDTADDGGPGWAMAFAAWWFTYLWAGIALAGRTIGKGLVGLRVVDRGGGPVGTWAAARRAMAFPFSFVLGLGFIPAVVGRERRALHDHVAGTREVVDWGARQAQLPAALGAWLEGRAAGRDRPAGVDPPPG